jgi:hypothetical protein
MCHFIHSLVRTNGFYLSLDVEGSEYDILKTFDFDNYKFRCITVEHNEPHVGPEIQMKIRGVLESNGYKYVSGNDIK